MSASFLQVKSSKAWSDVADIARNLQIIPSYASNANCGAETLRFTSVNIKYRRSVAYNGASNTKITLTSFRESEAAYKSTSFL